MMESSVNLRVRALLAIQGALLGAVTPDLRAVTLELTNDSIRIRFVYDRAIDEELGELVSIVETEVGADFGLDMTVEATAESIPDDAIPIKHQETPVFHRQESVGWEPVDLDG